MICKALTLPPLCLLLIGSLFAVPEEEESEKIEGTASTENFPAQDPDKALLSTITYPDEMKARVYARQPDALNVTAIAFDEQNRLYLAETHRFDRGIEDNRRNQHWLRDEIALTSTAERLAMYQKHAKVKPLEYFTKHSEKIRVLVDHDGDGKLDHSQLYADGFNDPLDGTAAGIFAANGKVYYACIPHVWMLEDSDGDLRADKRESLQEGYGISVSLSGHDLNGFAFGPDGRIYFTIGDRGYNLKTADGRHLYDQYAGAIFRMEPDGSGLEAVHTGLRNPKEIAFDQYGSAFSVDNNADMGDKARIVYMVEGAESGWHRGNQNLRNFRHAIDLNGRHQIPWMVEGGWEISKENRPAAYLPPIDFVSTGPSGLTYNPGTGLAKKWDHNFFICDYRGGKSGVIAFKMEPSGASYSLTSSETFIQGSLNTDMEFGYDGRVYLSDFTGSWQTYDVGTIFVFENLTELAKPAVSGVRAIFAKGFDQLAPEKLAQLLTHQDHRVRQRAQFALAKSSKNRQLLIGATTVQNPLLTRLHGLWGLGQLARLKGDFQSASTLSALTRDFNWRIRGQAAQALGNADPASHRATLAALLEDENTNTRMLAAIALGKVGNAEDIPALVTLLSGNKDPYLRHGAVQALQTIVSASDSAQAILALKDHPSSEVRLAAVLILRRLQHPGIAAFLADPEASVVIETIQAINDTYLEGARPALAKATQWIGKSTPMIDYRIINSIYRVGGPQNLKRLLKLASDDTQSADVRMEALFALQRWENPPAADPTTGKHRPLSGNRSLTNQKSEIKKTLSALLESTSGKLLAEVISATETFKLKIAPRILLTHLINQKNATSIRLAALKILQQTEEPKLRRALDKTLNDRDREIRASSFAALAEIDLPAALAQARIELKTDRTYDQQQILATLAPQNHPEVASLILASLNKLAKQAPALHLDILQAAEQRKEPDIVKALAAYNAELDPTNLSASYAVATEGGDLNQGRFLFYNHGAAQCTRCHKGQRGRKGGVAGPDLWNVGSLHDRTYLLDSIVNPGAHIAPGYGTVSLTLKDSTIVAGTLNKETKKNLTITDLASGEKKTYPRAQVSEMTLPISTMPPMAGILKKSEVRDLIAYLASLKDPKKKK
ncbi:MAG: quinoprotein glucose dehydrogenase [Paracoccaceae bacterium]|jgi:quinoprotein glucose dehydrogenase